MGAAIVALAGGKLVRLRLLDRRPLPGLDRRRLCEGRQHHHRAEGLRLSDAGAGRRQRACRRPARCWPASTTATSASRSTRPRPMSPPPRRRSRASRRQLDVQQAMIDAARATLDVDTAQLTFAEQDNKRYADLATTAMAACRTRSRRSRAIAAAEAAIAARHRHARVRPEAGRAAEGRDRASRARRRARRRAAASGRAEPLLHHDHLRRSTAWSATARCASASMCRPARS